MSLLEISLFGEFYIGLDGQSLNSLVSTKARALIAYLGTQAARPHRRSTLAALLWPEKTEPIARTNLRQTLHRLSHILGDPPPGPPYFLITNEDIQMNLRSNLVLDVFLFSDLVKFPLRHHQKDPEICENCLEDFQSSVKVYRGDLMSDFSLPGCLEFEWWLTCKREEYHEQGIEILKILARYYERGQDPQRAISYIQRAIEFEPWNERLHRQKMLLFAQSGQRCSALHQYEICQKALAEEAGVTPAIETTALYHQIKNGDFPAA